MENTESVNIGLAYKLGMLSTILGVVIGFGMALSTFAVGKVESSIEPLPQRVIISFEAMDLPPLGDDPFDGNFPASIEEVDPFATPTPACGTRQHMDSLQSSPAPHEAPLWSDQVVPDSIKVDPFPPGSVPL